MAVVDYSLNVEAIEDGHEDGGEVGDGMAIVAMEWAIVAMEGGQCRSKQY